jgi:hypothetical protein
LNNQVHARTAPEPDPAPRRAASSPAHGPARLHAQVLALQRTAGNRAVASLVGRRLQRSATDEDAERQPDDDVESVEHLLATGTSRLVDAVVPDPGDAPATPTPVATETDAVMSDAPEATTSNTAQSSFGFTFSAPQPTYDFSAFSSTPFVFSAPPLPPTPQVQTPAFTFIPPTDAMDEEERRGTKRLRGSATTGRSQKRRAMAPPPNAYPNIPVAFPIQQPILAQWPASRRLQRKNPLPGTFAPAKGKAAGTAFTWKGVKAGSAGKTRTTYTAKPNLTSNATTLATGLNTHATINATVGATRGTATDMKVKRWIVQKGTKTVKNVRPAGWDTFQSLCGFIDKKHKCVWVQGHLLYEQLGGRGNKMENLAPFTTSLNKRHQNQVEQPLVRWLKAAKKTEERTVDYQVIPKYAVGGPPKVITQALDYFRAFVDKRNADALKTLVKLGKLDAADQAAVAGQARTQAIPLTKPKSAAASWDLLCAELEQEITTYVAAAFPTQIDCYGRLYTRTGGGDWKKTRTQHHSLANHP